MDFESEIRLIMAVILLAGLGVSGFHRRRAAAADSTARRGEESTQLKLLRVAVAIPGLAILVSAFAAPSLVEWATFDAPESARWLGVPMAVAGAALAVWLFPHLGNNVTATALVKETHTLVTSGPYRWIRHPLYAAGLLMLGGTGLALANGAILAFLALFLITWLTIVIPREEAQLAERFGAEYLTYRERTGALLPWL